MTKAESCHNEAMNLAAMAQIEKVKGDEEGYYNLLEKALAQEKAAALELKDNFDAEPTRALLYKGVANLAYQCNELGVAKEFLKLGLHDGVSEEIQVAYKVIEMLIELTETYALFSFPEDVRRDLYNVLTEEAENVTLNLTLKNGGWQTKKLLFLVKEVLSRHHFSFEPKPVIRNLNGAGNGYGAQSNIA